MSNVYKWEKQLQGYELTEEMLTFPLVSSKKNVVTYWTTVHSVQKKKSSTYNFQSLKLEVM
jgi:hypothetical protein